MIYRKAAVAAVSGIILATGVISCDGDNPVIPTPQDYCHYLPLQIGNKWVFDVKVDTRYEPPSQYELAYEVTAVKRNYKDVAQSYVITVTKDGKPHTEITAAYDDDAVYLDRAIWSYLIADGMTKGGWTQTGLVDTSPLIYSRDEDVEVPAGSFAGCRVLSFENGSEYNPATWEEFYARGTGLVYYKYTAKEYESSPPYSLLDWRVVEYRLKSFTVKT